MIYLSRLILNPRSKVVRRDLADCQHLHRTIMAAFPQAPVGTVAAREHFGVLYRLESDARAAGPPALLVQSRAEPDWSLLEPGYLLDTGGDPENPAGKCVDGVYGRLGAGLVLTFRLRANPTRKIDTRSGPDGQRRNGKRVELGGEEAQVAWLRRKGEQGGFRLLAVRARDEVPNVRTIPGDKITGGRPSKSVDQGLSDDGRLTFGSVLFEGELRITDADQFRGTLERGVGSAKAYGFGLLSIARPRG